MSTVPHEFSQINGSRPVVEQSVQDVKALRLVTKATQDRLARESAVDQKLRTAQVQTELEKQRRQDAIELAECKREAKRRQAQLDAQAARERKAAERAESKTTRAERRAAIKSAAKSLHTWVPQLVPRVALSVAIASPMINAWDSQFSFATDVMLMSYPLALTFAAALEAGPVASAWMQTHAIDADVNPRRYSVATWAFAGFAGALNFWHNYGRGLEVALPYGMFSMTGVAFWHLYVHLRRTKKLRAEGALPKTLPRFGARRWLRFPLSTFRAWSVAVRKDIADRDEALASVKAAADRVIEDAAKQDLKPAKLTWRERRAERKALNALCKAIEQGQQVPAELLDRLPLAIPAPTRPVAPVQPEPVSPAPDAEENDPAAPAPTPPAADEQPEEKGKDPLDFVLDVVGRPKSALVLDLLQHKGVDLARLTDDEYSEQVKGLVPSVVAALASHGVVIDRSYGYDVLRREVLRRKAIQAADEVAGGAS